MTSATDNRTTELLPCPFCGGEAEMRTKKDISLDRLFYRYRCKDCHAGIASWSASIDGKEWSAATIWNTRAELGSERIAELEAENERLRNAGYEIGYHDAMKAAKRGTLTAEQVREAIERNFGKVAVIDDGNERVEWREGWVVNVGINYKAIADELNAELKKVVTRCSAH